MENIEEIFGKVVRRLRESKGHSQEAFASLAGVHRTYMSSIERGKVQISIHVAQKVAEALEIPLSQIFKQVEKDFPNEKEPPGQ